MSNEAIHWAWKQGTGSPVTKLILHVLADLADENHSCFPSIEHIVAKVEASEKTVRRKLEDLEAARLIRKERRYVQFGQRLTDRYFLDVEGQISAAAALAVKLTGNGDTVEKPQVSAVEVNLTGNGSAGPALAVNCDRYTRTPHEIRDKSLIIEDPADPEVAPLQIQNDLESRPVDLESAEDPSPAREGSEIDRELREIHPSLTVAAVTARLKVAKVEDVDLLNAARVILGRATRSVGAPAAFVAAAIDRTPDAWRPQLPGFEPGDLDGPRTSQLDELRARERTETASCALGEHDWGDAWLAETDRGYCVRPRCNTARRTVEPAYAELEARTFEGSN
ncbi:helix-turn-helix protein [Leucobacter komagatae]|uniref:Helix-turn-helix protein n=1 Tax=Leucobacter komagatae TaxID=55969 RepID=A0A542Y6H6_9MICO|nr:helix-turn-helix domain-containing protein [Leucobacter komagatae]TQL43683.1 helix-turn-helix protein [Leucobacter komagatae]